MVELFFSGWGSLREGHHHGDLLPNRFLPNGLSVRVLPAIPTWSFVTIRPKRAFNF